MEEKAVVWKDKVNKTHDLDGGMKQMCIGIKRILGKQAEEVDKGRAT